MLFNKLKQQQREKREKNLRFSIAIIYGVKVNKLGHQKKEKKNSLIYLSYFVAFNEIAIASFFFYLLFCFVLTNKSNEVKTREMYTYKKKTTHEKETKRERRKKNVIVKFIRYINQINERRKKHICKIQCNISNFVRFCKYIVVVKRLHKYVFHIIFLFHLPLPFSFFNFFFFSFHLSLSISLCLYPARFFYFTHCITPTTFVSLLFLSALSFQTIYLYFNGILCMSQNQHCTQC